MTHSAQLSLTPADNVRLANLCGAMDGNISHIARALSVRIARRGEHFRINGDAADIAAKALWRLYQQADSPFDADGARIRLAQCLTDTGGEAAPGAAPPARERKRRKMTTATNTATNGAALTTTAAITAAGRLDLRNPAQLAFWEKIRKNPVTLCAGPAGTGKTHVALAAALRLTQEGLAGRLILTRPAVEAGGERLGFLPGDMEQKVNPYLRPMHDVLRALLGRQAAERRMAAGEIEAIPLAFMRGLTLNDAVAILDEAQNTTPAQVKMLLTRLGENAKIIIVGDTTQSDLPPPAGGLCGLSDAIARLGHLDGVACHAFDESDIVRHPLAREILRAYG